MTASLKGAAEVLRYRKGTLDLLVEAYGSRTQPVLEALARAPRQYSVRVNTRRATPESVVERLQETGARCSVSKLVGEAVLIEVEGPFEVSERGKQVVAAKSAAESVMMGSKLYAPGILRTDGYRVGEVVRVTDKNNRTVGRGRAMLPPKVDKKVIKGLAVDTTESVYKLPPFRESDLYKEGMIREQSIPAMIASKVLDPQKGETIVDMCAAPGGKTLHMAQLMGNGTIYAFDHSERRLEALRSDARSLGADIKVACTDSRYLDRDFPSLRADKVLVDPPCSALGIRPKLYEEASAEEIIGCAKYQRQFLGVANKVVRRGGVVVYSTCTLTVQENEGMVKFAVEELGLEPVEQPIRVGEPGLGGAAKTQRFSPDLLEMPGFFIASFVKA